MNKSDLINMINLLEKKQQNETILRKANLCDFTENENENAKTNANHLNKKIKNYRMQGEFGEKKFIKP